MTIEPIGTIRQLSGRAVIEVDEAFEDALLGLDGFSHVHVFWWFADNDTPERRGTLRVYPRGDRDNPLTGVFATRSPARPNLIALTTCRILGVEGRRVLVDAIEARDGTPLVDLKPYIPSSDQPADVHVPGWVGRR